MKSFKQQYFSSSSSILVEVQLIPTKYQWISININVMELIYFTDRDLHVCTYWRVFLQVNFMTKYLKSDESYSQSVNNSGLLETFLRVWNKLSNDVKVHMEQLKVSSIPFLSFRNIF